VDDLDLAARRRQKTRVDEHPEHSLRLFPLRKHREKLFSVHRYSRPRRRRQIPEDLPHDWFPLGSDLRNRLIRLLRQRSGDSANREIRLPRQTPSLTVPLLPELRHREREEWESTFLPTHLRQDLSDQSLVLEPIPRRSRRLH
jgi:hypothetical protein